MFYLNKDKELTSDLLFKMISKFRTDVQPRLENYKKYYDGIQKIANKEYQDKHKPCSRTVTNYCLNIADSYCGYLATPGHISYRMYTGTDEIMEVLKYNDYQAQDADFLLDALIYGIACELMYMDEDSQVRFKLVKPTTCFGICDDTLTGDLLYFVRMYKESDWDDSDIYNVDVYSDDTIKKYKMQGMGGMPVLTSEERHYFSQCPANIFTLPDEKSIFDCIVSLQDAHNELLTSEIDDFSAFCDAYLTIIGNFDKEQFAEEADAMRENRILMLPEGVDVSWLTKGASDVQVENMLNRIHASIYRIACCPDFSSESFVSGVSSGIAIRYRLTGMETRAAKVCAAMKKALLRRIEIICGIATLKLGEDTFKDVEIEFKRNIPEDLASVANTIYSLKGIVSNATLLGLLDFVSDAEAELEAVKQQKEENESVYGFGFNFQDEDEDLEEDE